MTGLNRLRVAAFCLLSAALAAAAPVPVRIGLDAEFGNRTSTSDDAIKAGIEIAIEEINAAGGVLGGRKLELVTRDNRGVPARGVDNLKELAGLSDLVAVFGGKFSPVLLAQMPVAREHKIPLLDPWAAADAITQHNHKPNYCFRLSLRDGWVIPYLMARARADGHRKVGVMLPGGAWGRSNEAAADDYAQANSTPALVSKVWYEWSDESLANEYQDLLAAGAEAVILVANEPEAARLVRAIAEQPKIRRLPVYSHWGAAAGDLPALAGDALWAVDLRIVQTFSFVGSDRPRAAKVQRAAMRRLGARSPAHIPSPSGVAHGYDLMHLLARAIERAGTTDRTRIRDALEVLGPWDGLVQAYDPPFTPDRHDALGPERLLLVRWRRDGSLVPVAAPPG